MGNNALKFKNDQYSYYSTQSHPLQGQIDVYRIEGEGGYVMRKVNIHSDDIISLANIIQKEQNPFLIRYYGHEIPQTSAFCTEIIKTISVTTYWEYLNHDLRKDRQLNKIIGKDEKKIWSIIGNCAEAGRHLNTHGIAIEFNQYNIQFSPDKVVKVYWANTQRANMHRSYFRYFEGQKQIKSLYSPEQLFSMKQSIQNRKLNLEKCSIYSLGILLLSYILGIKPQQFYNYSNLILKIEMYNAAFEYLRNNYSQYLAHVFRAMTDQDPLRRVDYSILVRMIKSGVDEASKKGYDSKFIMDQRKSRHGQKISLKV